MTKKANVPSESAEAHPSTLEKVSSVNLQEASRLAASVFPYEVGRTPAEAFEASFVPEIRKEKFPNNIDMEYWLLRDNGVPGALTGIYERHADAHEAAWVGWTCVDPSMRGRGIGRKLVEQVIAEATRRNKKFLRLFTSDHPNEASARRLYLSMGFVVVNKEEEPTVYADGVSAKTVYMEKPLSPQEFHLVDPMIAQTVHGNLSDSLRPNPL